MSTAWDQAGQELQNSHLYVHPDAETYLENGGIPFTSEEQADSEDLLAESTVPLKIAVLPSGASTAGDARDLARGLGVDSVVALYITPEGGSAGGSALSTDLANFDREVETVLGRSSDVFEFVEGVVARAKTLAEGSGGAAPAGNGTSTPTDGGGGLLPLAILAAAGGGGFLLYRRNKRNRELTQLRQVRGALDEDITAYGERLSQLDLDVQADSTVPVEARREYERALDLYENAKTFADRAEKPEDLKGVTNALEEGRWLLGCVEARLHGQPLPERRAPCFFDPSHGPSIEDVEWAPPGGVPRPVPACHADALRLKQGLDPDVRMVPAGDDGERRPYWEAGPAYGAWAAGYFGAVLPAMMVGTMLGTTMAAPLAYGAAGDAGGGDFGGDFGGDAGGDFGGGFGDAGGGDFGGFGDFGGL